jgi:hypothetical protein
MLGEAHFPSNQSDAVAAHNQSLRATEEHRTHTAEHRMAFRELRDSLHQTSRTHYDVGVQILRFSNYGHNTLFGLGRVAKRGTDTLAKERSSGFHFGLSFRLALGLRRIPMVFSLSRDRITKRTPSPRLRAISESALQSSGNSSALFFDAWILWAGLGNGYATTIISSSPVSRKMSNDFVGLILSAKTRARHYTFGSLGCVGVCRDLLMFPRSAETIPLQMASERVRVP